MLLNKKFLSHILLILLAFAPNLVMAETTISPELYISSKGIAEIRGAQVVAIHALNLISVGIWGQKWTVSMDYTTKFQSSDGTEIKPEQIALGHVLEIKGTPSKQQQGVVEALLIRDMSIGAGSANSVSGSLLDSLCYVPVLVPQQSVAGSSVLLMRTIGLGAKGLDVKTLQEFLQKKGIGIPNDGPVTGFFGKLTEDAVKKFQEANGLEAIGSVGAKTRELINNLLNIH